MKSLLKPVKLLFLFFILASASIFFWFYVLLPAPVGSVSGGEPLARVLILGDMAGNNVSLTRWQRSPNPALYTKHAPLGAVMISHFDNPSPSGQESDTLGKAGLHLITLPFMSTEDLEYELGEELSADYAALLKRDFSVKNLTGTETGLAVLHFPLNTTSEELKTSLAAVTETGMPLPAVKFSPDAGSDWDKNQFTVQARAAVDCGAKIVIGHHAEGLSPIEIYKESLIVPGLDFFLGGKNKESAFILVTAYADGIKVDVYPLMFKDNFPALHDRPWHYLQAKQVLDKTVPREFTRHGLTASYRTAGAPEPLPAKPGRHAGYGVVAGHPLAVEAGLQILRAGGNAVDAAAAVSYALSVVEPQGSGLGGGGIMLIHLAAENRQVVVDYRETAPFTLDREEIKKIMNWPSTGIPGFVRGLEKAVADYGAMKYKDVIAPAYRLASEGFPMSEELSRRIRNNTGKLARSQDALTDFFHKGWPAPVGHTIKQPTLANTLQNIMAEGSKAFYEGYISDSIIEVLSRQGMKLSPQDLSNYRPVLREPIKGDYRDYTVVTVPPPAGGFNLLQQLKILEHYQLTQPTPPVYYLMEQVLKATYSDRRSYVGDPNFVLVPMDELLSDSYVREKVEQINSGDVPHIIYADPYRPSDNTTHIVVVDALGNWVSVTNTISYYFGYGLQAEGFFLNTQLNNFSSDPSSPNYFQAGKRPFSHISPTLLLQNNTPVMALGTPGGRRIPAMLAQVLVRFIDFGYTLPEAVDAPRFWSEGRTISLEKGGTAEISSYFAEKGYTVVQQNPDYFFGRLSAIFLDPKTGELTGSGDPLRGEGIALIEDKQ
jgi:gamma-glutamyltranspeptidase / glutathione hydrolase